MSTLLYMHSIGRWVVVIALICSIVIAWRGLLLNRKFSKRTNHLRHWTATFAHIQLIIGVLLAAKSPYFTYFWKNLADVWENTEAVFYGLIHPGLMLVAIIIITIGSAKAKRKQEDRDKFKTMLIWFSLTAVILFMAIPWPFSPFSMRPLLPI